MTRAAYPSLLLLSLTLAACGGGSGGGNGETTMAAAATQSPAATASAQVAADTGNAPVAGPASSSAATPTTSVSPTAPAAAPSADDSSTPAPAPTPAPAATPTPAPAATPTPAPAPASTPAPAPNAAKTIIEYYGDSTVWGYRTDAGGQVARPAPAVFAESIANASAYDVRNEGVSGSTACGLLNGEDGKHPAWSTQMANSEATYVLVNYAINDEWKYDVATYKGCLTSLARIAKQHGKQMIFETPNPTRDSGSWGLDVYVNAMKEVASAESLPVIDQYAYLTNYLNGRSPYTICPDGLHPTEAVYEMKGKYAASVFPSLIK